MKVTGTIAAVVLLAGCATAYDRLDARLATLRGQDIDATIAVFGIPAREYQVAGMTAYEWVTQAPAPSRDAPAVSCTMRALVKDRIVQRVQYDGANGACLNFAMAT